MDYYDIGIPEKEYIIKYKKKENQLITTYADGHIESVPYTRFGRMLNKMILRNQVYTYYDKWWAGPASAPCEELEDMLIYHLLDTKDLLSTSAILIHEVLKLGEYSKSTNKLINKRQLALSSEAYEPKKIIYTIKGIKMD